MKSTNFIRQWASYLTEGLKSYDEIIEDNAQLNTHKVKVEVSNIEWESYEGNDYDEDNEGGFVDVFDVVVSTEKNGEGYIYYTRPMLFMPRNYKEIEESIEEGREDE